MTTYQRLTLALDKIKDDSIAKPQIESLMSYCKTYWECCEQYNKLNRAREQLRQHLYNKKIQNSKAPLKIMVYISFLWNIYCDIYNVSRECYSEYEEACFFNIVMDKYAEENETCVGKNIDNLLRTYAEKHNISPATLDTDGRKIRKALKSLEERKDIEIEDGFEHIAQYEIGSVVSAVETIQQNKEPHSKTREECVNAVLSDEFADIVEAYINQGTEKAKYALRFMIVPIRRALCEGTITNYAPFSEATTVSKIETKKKKGVLVFTGVCKENLETLKKRNKDILQKYFEEEEAQELREVVSVYIGYCEDYRITL